jgi:hypothetical protein
MASSVHAPREDGAVDKGRATGSPRSAAAPPRAERAVFAALLVLYLLLSLLVFDQIEEDAFIYFRLVGNLAHGNGFVFNRGAAPIEAGSSLLWMALLLLFWKAPWGIVLTAKLLGLCAGCVSLWLVLCIAREHSQDPVLRLGPVLLTIGSTPFLMWSQRGLETPLVVLLVLWLALCCTASSRFRWWPLPAALLLLARPEGFLFALALIPVLGWNRGRWCAAVPSILVVAAAGVALEVGRFLYFHDLVPSPFYVKLRTGGGGGLSQIGQYVLHSQLFVLGSPLLLAACRPRFWTRQRSVLGGFILIAAGWCVLAKDWMPYVRHLVPAIPLACVLLVAAADALAARAGRFRKVLLLGYIGVTFVVTLMCSRSSGYFGGSGKNAVFASLRTFAASPRQFPAGLAASLRSPVTPISRGAVTNVDALSNFQSQVGEFLRRNYPANSVVIYDQMGQTPFYAGPTMRFFDTLGLTDRTIGRFYFERSKRRDASLRIFDAVGTEAVRLAFGEQRAQITATQALDYLFGLNPDLILMNAFVLMTDPDGIPAHLSRDPRLQGRYALRYTLAGWVQVYERKAAPPRRQIDVPPGLSVDFH